MRIVPKSLSEKVQFYQDHLAVFAENAGGIGLSTEEVAALAAKSQAARDALAAQREAQSAARAATLRANLAVKELGSLGSSIILKIRATAEATNDPGVYTLAQIPPVAAGAPTPPPGTPEQFTVSLAGNGSLLLKWKCDNPRGSSGTMYQVSRRIIRPADASAGAGEVVVGEFVQLAVVGKKQFRDDTIPAGATQMTYRVRAIRSTRQGVAAEHNVNFGTNGHAPVTAFQTRHAA